MLTYIMDKCFFYCFVFSNPFFSVSISFTTLTSVLQPEKTLCSLPLSLWNCGLSSGYPECHRLFKANICVVTHTHTAAFTAGLFQSTFIVGEYLVTLLQFVCNNKNILWGKYCIKLYKHILHLSVTIICVVTNDWTEFIK